MSRRSRFSVWLALALAAAYLVATTWVRWHVDGLVQHAVGRELPAFALADNAGKQWSAAELRGKRAVLHFFRSHCEACAAEASVMRELEANLPGDVVLLHVMTDAVLRIEPAVSAATIVADGFARPVLMADAAFVDAFHTVQWSSVTPVTYVVDARGVVRFGLRGKQTREAIEEALAAAR
jgi:peroxiredoxin